MKEGGKEKGLRYVYVRSTMNKTLQFVPGNKDYMLPGETCTSLGVSHVHVAW